MYVRGRQIVCTPRGRAFTLQAAVSVRHPVLLLYPLAATIVVNADGNNKEAHCSEPDDYR